jgi:hypothetical protein
MSHPQSVDEFREQLYSRKHTLHQLRMKLQAMPKDQRWTALLSVFIDPCRRESAFADQELAGRLLVEVEPKCTDTLEYVLKTIAPCWNVSVEQLPIYLCRVFGHEAVSETAMRLRSSFSEGSREERTLDTVCWWLRETDITRRP